MTEEMVDIVDKNNQVINTVPRRIMRRDHLPHRATYIVIADGNGKFYVQIRTKTKDYCPGMLDACTGGVVSTGEDYQDGALRELYEEMGIQGKKLRFCGIHQLGVAPDMVFGGLYYTVYQGELQLQESEVAGVIMMTREEILTRVAEFTPDSIEAFRIILTEIKK